MKLSQQSLISILLLVFTGWFLRSMSHGEITPLREPFSTFPQQIGRWNGSDGEMDSKVLQILRVDDYLLRSYTSDAPLPVELYVGYYKSQREGATYHSPKNCLPGAGWSFVQTGTIDIQIPQQSSIAINQFVIQKGLDKQMVFYWYQDRGRVVTSEYWAKVYMMWDALKKNRTDGAFVRITVPFYEGGEKTATSLGQEFAATIFPLLQSYLPN